MKESTGNCNNPTFPTIYPTGPELCVRVVIPGFFGCYGPVVDAVRCLCLVPSLWFFRYVTLFFFGYICELFYFLCASFGLWCDLLARGGKVLKLVI